MRRSTATLFMLFILAGDSLRAQECTPDPAESLFAFFQNCLGPELRSKGDEAGRVASTLKRDLKSNAEATTKETATEMATSTAAPEGFAERVNDSIADFLPLFQFAVNGVTTSDDKKSVTVKFNSPPLFGGRTAVKATVSEPQFFSTFENKIIEPARTAQAKSLLGETGDFSDITYSFDWGLRLSAGNWRTSRHLYGREFETYEKLVDELAEAAIDRFVGALKTPRFAEAFLGATENLAGAAGVFGLPLEDFVNTISYMDLEARVASEADPALKQRKEEALAGAVSSLRTFAGQEIVARSRVPDLDAIDSLIANQPELILKGSRRDADEVVGQRETVVTFSYEMGLDNFNRVLREYRRLLRQRPAGKGDVTPEEDRDIKLAAFESVVKEAKAENRFVFTGTYKGFSDYEFRHSYNVETVDTSGATVTTAQVAELTIPSSSEWHVKVLFSKPVRSFLGGGSNGNGIAPVTKDLILPSEKRSRVDFSLEGIWVDEDRSIAEALRRKDRVVGRLTFTQPLANGMSFPVSIVYANRSELLANEKKVMSAHVGLSYKLLRSSDRPQ